MTVLTFLGFMAFNFASSIVYVVNDIVDKDRDRLHPKKVKTHSGGRFPLRKHVVLLVLGVLTILFFIPPQLWFEMVVIGLYAVEYCVFFLA
ncbi:MAG: hypothetical protein IPN18_04900 [Ignavibacteriales bacterium]|nr:hypothetical protein [Ignavibacteriales bacterium]